MLSESLHPNRLVAGSFASPSRDLLQIGFRLYPLPNNAITGKAGDIGFIQRNGWFGRSYRQTVKLSDFVSHPPIGVEPITYGLTCYLEKLLSVSNTRHVFRFTLLYPVELRWQILNCKWIILDSNQ